MRTIIILISCSVNARPHFSFCRISLAIEKVEIRDLYNMYRKSGLKS